MNNKEIKCIKCNELVEKDDNFCHNCGHYTAKGYLYLKDENNLDKITSGYVYKQNNKFMLLGILTGICIILFVGMTVYRGSTLFKPYFYIKKQITSYIYGYNSSIVVTDNIYNKQNITSIEDAKSMITKDLEGQKWQCSSDIEVNKLEYNLQENYNILSVNLCDVSIEESKKITSVIERMYQLFPNIKGGLTNVTITNAKTKEEYIAYFRPLYQFVNSNEDINIYNKVNKTEILLNSYYFLNDNTSLKEDYYVKDATVESTIAHEFGHYITFKTLLNQYNIDNIMLVTKDNEEVINNIINSFDNGYSLSIVNESIYNYNIKYNTNISIEEYAMSISNYAASKDKNGNLLYDEIIAEAVHDYYLHGNNANNCSLEIINVLNSKL